MGYEDDSRDDTLYTCPHMHYFVVLMSQELLYCCSMATANFRVVCDATKITAVSGLYKFETFIRKLQKKEVN